MKIITGGGGIGRHFAPADQASLLQPNKKGAGFDRRPIVLLRGRRL
jgi:hypothetical protein